MKLQDALQHDIKHAEGRGPFDWFRGIREVRKEIRKYKRANPRAKRKEIRRAVTAKLKKKYGDDKTNWLDFLLELLKILLPLLIL